MASSSTKPDAEFLGRWKSGRTWKTPTPSRSSSVRVTTGVKGHSWAEKKAQRQQVKLEKAYLDELKTAREAKQQAKAQRREASKRRKEAAGHMVALNTHQVMTNSKKLKRLSKKQKTKLLKQ